MVQKSTNTVKLNNQNTGLKTSFQKTEYTEAIFKYLDGNTSLNDIFKKIIASPKYKKNRPTIPKLKNDFKTIFQALSLHDWMFLRDQSVKHPETITEIQSRVIS